MSNNYNKNMKKTTTTGWGRNIKNRFSDLEVLKIGDDNYENEVVSLENRTLKDKWCVWEHDMENRSWDLDSYNKIYTIETVYDFWQFINNFNKMGFKFIHYFIMKEGITPTWEDVNNRDGGVCSIRVDMKDALKAFEEFSVKMVLDKITDVSNDINGLSISSKTRHNCVLLKLWNRDSKNILTETMSKDILDKYGDLSIKYKTNEPEY